MFVSFTCSRQIIIMIESYVCKSTRTHMHTIRIQIVFGARHWNLSICGCIQCALELIAVTLERCKISRRKPAHMHSPTPTDDCGGSNFKNNGNDLINDEQLTIVSTLPQNNCIFFLHTPSHRCSRNCCDSL